MPCTCGCPDIPQAASPATICELNIDKKKALLMSNVEEMYALLIRIESYFKNRHIYGPGVEESVSKKLMIRIERVMKKAEGKICERE